MTTAARFGIGVTALLCLLAQLAGADQTFLTEAEAPRAVFPDADRFSAREVVATDDLRARVERRLGDAKPSIWEPKYTIVAAFRGARLLGHAVAVDEIGKHRAISLMVGVGVDDRVAAVAVMTYREAYGGEIRSKRFLAQYRGKGAEDPLLPSQDIQNISGATLSARAVGRAVKKAIAVLAEAGLPASPGAALTVPPSARVPTPARVREAYYVMGTILEITVDAPSAELGHAWIRRAAAEARRLDRELSSFDAESALSRLNASAGAGPCEVPPDLYRVIAASIGFSRRSGGAFDVTVAPLIALWRQASERGRLPGGAELAAARRRVGSERIALVPPSRIALPPGSSVDLGGIAKGYAADRMQTVLRELGATSALVNFGGSSMVALGPPAGTRPWPIWLRRGGSLEGPLRLRDAALSTSGSLGQTERVRSRRFGHILDPRSGWPIERDAQATVVAPSATEAEVWSKALLVAPAVAQSRMSTRSDLSFVVFAGGDAVRSARLPLRAVSSVLR